MSQAWVLGTARAARGVADARGAAPDAVHPAVLPRRQRRPGGEDLPVVVDGVPARPGLRRVPAAELAAAGRLVRHGGAVSRRGHRGRLLRQAARDADPAHGDRARPADRGGGEGRAHRDRDRPARGWRSASPIASGVLGFVLLVVLTALWAVVFVGFMQLIALKTRSAAATNSGGLIFFPLLFLTPNFVPRHLLTRPMEVAATFNPVTYVMEALRSLILEDLVWSRILARLRRGRGRRRADARAQRSDDPELRLDASSARAVRDGDEGAPASPDPARGGCAPRARPRAAGRSHARRRSGRRFPPGRPMLRQHSGRRGRRRDEQLRAPGPTGPRPRGAVSCALPGP